MANERLMLMRWAHAFFTRVGPATRFIEALRSDFQVHERSFEELLGEPHGCPTWACQVLVAHLLLVDLVAPLLLTHAALDLGPHGEVEIVELGAAIRNVDSDALLIRQRENTHLRRHTHNPEKLDGGLAKSCTSIFMLSPSLNIVQLRRGIGFHFFGRILRPILSEGVKGNWCRILLVH